MSFLPPFHVKRRFCLFNAGRVKLANRLRGLSCANRFHVKRGYESAVATFARTWVETFEQSEAPRSGERSHVLCLASSPRLPNSLRDGLEGPSYMTRSGLGFIKTLVIRHSLHACEAEICCDSAPSPLPLSPTKMAVRPDF